MSSKYHLDKTCHCNTETYDVNHVEDCIHYANHYLIRLLSGNYEADSDEIPWIILGIARHRLLKKHYVFQNQKMFRLLFGALLWINKNLDFDRIHRRIDYFLLSLNQKQATWILMEYGNTEWKSYVVEKGRNGLKLV